LPWLIGIKHSPRVQRSISLIIAVASSRKLCDERALSSVNAPLKLEEGTMDGKSLLIGALVILVAVVGYDNIQFTKAPHVLRGMGLADLAKSAEAVRELTDKGMAPA
jgi:hypothetical protein